MAREALFNILRNRVDFESLRVLDLFSGTGSITYEFASLECTDITAVEWNRFLTGAIRKNLDSFRITTVNLVQADVFRFLAKKWKPFDLIFADPPFDHPRLNEFPDLIYGTGLLTESGMFILEHGPSQNFRNHPKWKETRHYGKVNFSFFGD